MPLIQAPQTNTINPSSGLITDPAATNISPPEVMKRLNPSVVPYLNFGGTLHGANGKGTRLITLKSDEEIKALKLQKYKDELISQGYREVAPNQFSKDVGDSKYVVKINPQTGDVVSRVLSNEIFSQPRPRKTRKNGGWFGTPEAMAMIQRAQHPALFDYTIKRLQDKGNVVELTSKGWKVAPIRDIINMNIATERANRRKQNRLNNQQSQNSAKRWNSVNQPVSSAISSASNIRPRNTSTPAQNSSLRSSTPVSKSNNPFGQPAFGKIPVKQAKTSKETSSHNSITRIIGNVGATFKKMFGKSKGGN